MDVAVNLFVTTAHICLFYVERRRNSDNLPVRSRSLCAQLSSYVYISTSELLYPIIVFAVALAI